MAFSQLESVQQHLAAAIQCAASEITRQLTECLSEADEGTESPIEAIFKLWWKTLQVAGKWRMPELDLFAQYPTREINGRTYRIDFVVSPFDTDLHYEGTLLGVNFPMLAIELDGHEFHERTKEQAIQRNQRDRDLQEIGFKLFHVSGSELYRDPPAVVGEAGKVATHDLNEFCRKIRSIKATRPAAFSPDSK